VYDMRWRKRERERKHGGGDNGGGGGDPWRNRTISRGLYPADPGLRDAIFCNVISRNIISCDAISRDIIFCDVISCDVISRDGTPLSLRDVIPRGPFAHRSTVAPTTSSCIPELEPTLCTYYRDFI